MMTRATLLSGQQYKGLLALCSRATATSPVSSAAVTDSGECSTVGRSVRQEPGKVRLGFIPEEWFTLFYKKTGVTGPYALGVTLGTYLFSKEIYVMEHEYYSGLSLMILAILAVKKLGPGVAKSLDKGIDEYETSWNEGRVSEKNALQEQIDEEEKLQWSIEGQNILLDAKRENVALQLEAAYRERVQLAFQEVRKKLDYQVEIQNIEKRISQRNLVDWVVRKVTSSITPDQESKNIDKCIADLGGLARNI